MTRKKDRGPDPLPICVPKAILPGNPLFAGSIRLAAEINPVNAPSGAHMELVSRQVPALLPAHLGLLTQKKWPAGSTIPVFFLDNPSKGLVRTIMAHANAWPGNLAFAQTLQRSQGIINVGRYPGQGYWCYTGTDCAAVARGGHQTMNLDSFTLRTPEAEYRRVVRHEFGHGRGFPHGQALPGTYECVDVERFVTELMRTQGWTRETAMAQVEHVLASQVALFGADRDSVMTYPVPYVKPGCDPIKGGTDITPGDAAADLRFYPFPTKKGMLFALADLSGGLSVA